MTIPAFPRGDEPRSGVADPVLYNVVYCSRAAPGTGEAAVQRIISTARRWNPEYGITGLLVFGSGIFFQWLEGPRDTVTSLMSRIRADRHHDSIVLLSESEEARERLFPNWDMELVSGDHIREVLQDSLDSATDPHNARTLGALLNELDAGQLRSLGST